jgi:hypothetical protein
MHVQNININKTNKQKCFILIWLLETMDIIDVLLRVSLAITSIHNLTLVKLIFFQVKHLSDYLSDK